MKHYQYKLIKHSLNDIGIDNESINILAKKGWRLINIRQGYRYGTGAYVFEREVQPDSPYRD